MVDDGGEEKVQNSGRRLFVIDLARLENLS